MVDSDAANASDDRHRRRAQIEATPLFQSLDARSLQRLADDSTIVDVARGAVIMHEGGAPDSLYIVIHGSLEVFRESDEGARVLDVLGDGASVGEMGVLTGEPRTLSVRARRDSTLLRVPAGVFEEVLQQNAHVTLQLARTLSDRLKRTTSTANRQAPMTSVALVRACAPGDFSAFCRDLTDAFERAGHRVALVSPDVLGAIAGEPPTATGRVAATEERLAAIVAALERSYDYVLCACDLSAAGWTGWSIRQVDLVLLVGTLGPGTPAAAWPHELDAVMPVVELVARGGTRVELALVRDGGRPPVGTAAWHARGPFQAHHHVGAAARGDYERLVRRLTGQAWGLVLGGGGARGFAHIGVIRALLEGGMPIDMVGGTSMGAILAAQYAMGCDVDGMLAMTRRAYVDGPASNDLTLPYVSLHTGRGTYRTLKTLFGDRLIEDLPTPYFCVSSNLTRAETMVHDRGPLWFWTRVSCAIPGLVPPVPYKGDVLVDGGLLDNLPVDVMRRRLRGRVAASDVSVRVDLAVDTSLVPEEPWSGSRQLFRKFTDRPRLPNIVHVLMRTAEISSVRDSQVSGNPADLYVRVPVDGIAMTDFKAIDRIVALGYEYTARRLEEFRTPLGVSRSE